MKDNEHQQKTLPGIENGRGPEVPERPGDSGRDRGDRAAAGESRPAPEACDQGGEDHRGAAEMIRQVPGENTYPGAGVPAAGVCLPARTAPEGGPDENPGILELIYGILFDPVRTFRRIAGSPPAGKVLVIFTIVKVLSILVFVVGGLFSSHSMFSIFPGQAGQGMAGAMRAAVPVAAVLGLIYEYFKWFVYSGILYLLAGLFGGRGRAAGVLAVTGLASLPALIILPFQMLLWILGGGGWMSGPAGILFWLATLSWGTVLVVIGIRETQLLSTGRAVAVALTPAAGLVAVFILLLVLLAAVAAPLGSLFDQFDDITF